MTMKWQPIETAPKDGSEFLAYDGRVKKMDVCIIKCHRNHCWIYPTLQDREGQLEDEFGYDEEDITHWMPLPLPPQAKSKKPRPALGQPGQL